MKKGCTAVWAVLLAACSSVAGAQQHWQPPVSADKSSHFEQVNGRQVWFVDGLPFTALGAETEWKDIVYPHYHETMRAYDYTFRAARALHMDMLKVPVKWSQIEPEEGQYDFSYVDHVLRQARKQHLKIAFDWFGHYGSLDGTLYCDKAGWMFAPTWVIADTRRFPRAVDAEGVMHDNAASYADSEIVPVEARAFAAFLRHIRDVDAARRTVIGIQVENEITVFNGTHRDEKKFWRDHSAAANRLYLESHATDDLRFTAWEYTTRWLRPLTDAGYGADPLPFFMNFVGGQLQPDIVGGSPGEDASTYLANLPHLTFIGLNNYVWGTEHSSSDDFRRTLNRYRVGRNLPAITETNSGNTPFTTRSLFLATGEYGSPLFTPWSLVVSYPEKNQPYVLPDGKLANGAVALGRAYDVLERALPAISVVGGTPRAHVFQAELPGQRFSQTDSVDGMEMSVAGAQDGQTMVLQLADHELLLLGYDCTVRLRDPKGAGLPGLQIEAGGWTGRKWKRYGDVHAMQVKDAGGVALQIFLTEPQVIRIDWKAGQ